MSIGPIERHYTVKELSVLLKIRPATVRQWLKSEKIKGVKFGGENGDWRIPESEAVRLVNEAYGAKNET